MLVELSGQIERTTYTNLDTEFTIAWLKALNRSAKSCRTADADRALP